MHCHTGVEYFTRGCTFGELVVSCTVEDYGLYASCTQYCDTNLCNYHSVPYPLNVTTTTATITVQTPSSTGYVYTNSIKCYSCLSNDPNSGCGNQFNANSPDVSIVTCTVDGYSCYLEQSLINGIDQYLKSTCIQCI